MTAHPASASVAAPTPHAQALDAAPVGIAILDRDLRYRYLNPALAAINRLPVTAHLGRTMDEALPYIGEVELSRLRAVARGAPDIVDEEVAAPDPACVDGLRRYVVSYRGVRDADGGPDGVIATITEVTEERRQERYVGALQELAAALGPAGSPAEIAEITLEAVLPTLGADRGAVALVSADGTHLDVVGSHGYREGELTARRVRRDVGADDPLAEVSRSGELLVYETDAAFLARYPSFERRRAGGGAIAAIGMPRAAVPVGGLIIAWPSERIVPAPDLAFLRACSRLAGQALERVRSDGVARRRAEGLARTLAAIAGEREPEAIARRLLHEAMPGAGARWGAVRIHDEDLGITRILHRQGFSPGAPAAEDLPLDADTPAVQAIRERREVLIPDLEAATGWGSVLPGFVAEGQRASACVPMLRGDHAIGCLTLGFDAVQPFDEAQLSYVRALAEATTSALERARLTVAERRSRRLLTETLDQLPIGVFVAEPGRGLVFQNQEVERILGARMPYGPLADLGIRRLAADGSDMAPADWPIARALDGGETVVGHESQYERGDGRLITVRTTARPVTDAEGRVIAAVSVFSDVTAERAADEAREAFLGVLSHELRTPVTAIFGGSMLLARHRDDVPEMLAPVVDDVAAEALRLQRLVEDLLVIARVERGMPVADRELVMIGHVVRRVIGEESPRWEGTTFGADVAPALPPVLGDAGPLEVVLRNLLGNAAKYGAANVRVGVTRVGECVRVSVEDDGPGLDVPPERLFRLFERGRTAAKRAAGSGIGLFVCRSLVEGMGGRIWAEPLPAGGTAFRFELAAEVEPPDDAGATLH